MDEAIDDPMNRESFASHIAVYLADKERSIQLIRWFLKTICFWSLSKNASVIERILSEFLILTWYFIVFSTIVPCGLAIFYEGQGNMEMRMLHIGPFIYFVTTAVKYSCLLLHIDDIRSCVECIETDWRIATRGEDRDVMLRYSRTGRLAAILLAVFMHSGVQSYNITRSLITNVVKVNNSSILFHELPYLFYNEILDVRSSPGYEMMLIVQCISSFLVSGVTVTICGLTAMFVMHACGQLKILRMRLDDIVDGNVVVGTVQQRLGFIVEHHLRVINFVSHIEELIYMTCFVELTTVSFSLCILGYCSIMEWNQNRKENIPTYCMISVSFLLNMFVLCYIGEMLCEQYRRVGIASYMTEWYRLPRKTALGLLLINMRSNSFDISLTAGKIIELSLSTFANLLKASMTYLNMLRAMTL